PVDLPGLSAVEGAGALPVRRVAFDGRPRQARLHVLAVFVPLAEKIDLAVGEGALPDVEVAGLQVVGPGVLPLPRFAVVGAEAESLQRASVVDALEVLDGDLSVEIPGGGQLSRRLLP